MFIALTPTIEYGKVFIAVERIAYMYGGKERTTIGWGDRQSDIDVLEGIDEIKRLIDDHT